MLWIIIVFSVLPFQGITTCTIFDELYNIQTPPTTVQNTFDLTQDWAIGMWVRFIPASDPSFTKFTNYWEQSVVFAIHDITSNYYRFALTTTTNRYRMIQGYNIFIFTDTWQEQSIIFDDVFYEGQWTYFYLCVEVSTNKLTVFTFFNGDQDSTFRIQAEDFTVGSQVLTIDIQTEITQIDPILSNISYNYLKFKGKLAKLEFRNQAGVYYETIPELLIFISAHCQFPVFCPATLTIDLIKDTQQFTGSFFMTQQQYLQSAFTISGWAKIDPYNELSTTTKTLIRAAIFSEYFDDSVQGDRVFLLKYQQSHLPEQNGFFISTSNMYYADIQFYATSMNDHWSDYNSFYQIAITKWHFFQFQYGLSDPKSNTQGYIYFSHGDVVITKKFENKRLFTDSIIYISVGGDYYSPAQFTGFIGQLKLRYCNSADIEIIKYCHYSCKTCNGPTAIDCLTCVDNLISHRSYVSNLKACLCDQSYLDYYDKPNCQASSDDFNFVTKTEIAIPSNELCAYGTFIYNNQCIKCPIQVSATAIFCADCYINQKSWYLNPICSIDYVIHDYTQQTVYTMSNRQESELEYYLIDDVKQTVILCPGCKRQKLIFSEESIQVLQLSQTIDVICKSGYQVNDNYCMRKDEHCLIFDQITQVCTLCLQGFTYNSIEKCCSQCPVVCPQCEFKNGKTYCLSCKENQSLSDGQCYQCGQYCSVCAFKDAYLKCYRCIDDYQYYLSFDGVNCLQNEIPNCKLAIQLKQLDASTLQSSIDLNFVPSTDLTGISTMCALCNSGFTNYEKQSKCEDLGNSATQSIVDKYGDTVEILSDSSGSLVLQGSKCSKSNCVKCMQNYLRSSEFCILCQAGYYANQITGACSTCPKIKNCSICINQHKIYKDVWKQELIPYYFFYINNPLTENHHYSVYAASEYIEDYEIVCQSCISGYTLVQDQCIKSCPENCLRCELINNQFICVQCPNTIQGQIQSLDQNECLQCPYNCALCRTTPVSEYANINFNPDYTELLPFANKCIKSLELTDLSFNWEMSLFTQCSLGSNCLQSITIPLNVYCDDEEFTSAYNALETSAQTDFLNRNIKLSEVFSSVSTTHFSQIETKTFLLEMNKQIIQQATYKLTLLYDNLGTCVFPSNKFIDSKLSKNIYSLINLQVELIGDIDKSVIFQNQLEIKGFTSIKIKNVNILREYSFTLQLTNSLDVLFENIKISDKDFNNQLSSQILIINSNVIVINKIEITNMNLINTDGLFSHTYVINKDISLSLQNINIFNSNFHNSKFLKFMSNSVQQTINLQQILVESTTFTKSNFIINSFTGFTQLGFINMKQLDFKQLTITDSTLIFLSGMITQQINQFFIDNSQLDNSIILHLNIFEITGLICTNNHLISSQLISNFISNSFTNADLYSLRNVEIKRNTYTKYRVFLDIRQQFHISTTVIIDQLQLVSNYLNYDGTSESILADFSNLYIQASKIIMTNILIVRGLGYPEFTLSNSQEISIINLESYLDADKFIPVFNYNSDCSGIIPDIYTTLIFITHLVQILETNPNKSLTFDRINIHDLIIINQALIVLISENKISHTNQETITFKNSQFKQVIMIITKLAQQQSIISILSEQSQNITLIANQFINNLQHVYVQDFTHKSSSTILIKSPLAYVLLSDSIFEGNQATNSKDSNFVSQSYSLTIEKCQFLKTNHLNIEIFYKYLIWGSPPTQIVYLEDLNAAFPIQTSGGSGFLNANYISILNSYIEKSNSQIGGAFKLQTKGSGEIRINNTIFQECQASFEVGLASTGGSILIDSSESNLNLIIQNTRIINSKSRDTGGAIYIIPSSLKSIIQFNNLTVIDTYAINSQFLQIDEIQSTTVILRVTFQGVYIVNSEAGYNKFLGLINYFSATELANYASNTMIAINNGIFKLHSSGFNGIRQSGILSLHNMEHISITNTQIQNIVLGVQNLLQLTLSDLISGQILMDSVSFMDIKQEITISSANCDYKQLEKYVMLCLKDQPTPNMLYQFYSSQISQEITQCNLQQIQSYRTNKYPLIDITKITSSHFLSISKMEIEQINCPDCINGIISISEIDINSNKVLVQFQNILMQNNYCGKLSCIVIQNSQSYKFSRILQQQARYKKKYTFYMAQSYFLNNHGTVGGVMYIEDVDTLIYSSTFNENTATSIGGAIYFTSSTSQLFNIYDSVVSRNYAKIGGGIYLNNQTINSESSSGLSMTENVGTFYGANFVENPRSLAISWGTETFNKILLSNTTDSIIELISIKPYSIGNQTYNIFTVPSGQKISEYQFFSAKLMQFVPANLTLRLHALNSQNQQMKNLVDTNCTIAAKIIDIDSITNQEPYFYNYTEPNTITFNLSSQDYNLDGLIIKFDPDLNNLKKLQLKFTCNSIKIPVFSLDPPYLLETSYDNYTLLMNVQTYQCKSGEYKKSDDGTCLLCDVSADQFTVKAGEKCKFKDQISMETITSARVKLKPEYWRPYESSIQVEQCKNLPINCNGGWEPGNDSCFEGHVGALCEQCDIYDIRGGGSYSISTAFKCGSCNEVGGNINKIVLISFWTLISIMLSVTSTMDSIESAVIGKMFQRLGIISYSPWHGMGGILIKVLTNYFQIVVAITTFQLQLPSGLSTFFSSVGSPIEAMSYSLDCFLSTLALSSGIEMLYFRVIWGILMPLMYITAFFTIYGIGVLAEKARKSFSAITTTFIYMYIYLQPTLIGSLISLVSFRYVSGYYWVQGNVAYRYDTYQHAKWLAGFVVPFLLLLAILIPLYMFYSVFKIRGKLDSLNNKKSWGYLYNEYRHQAYFWEIVKIIQKSLIIIFLAFYEDQIIIKAALIFIVVYIYSLLSKKYTPYELNFLNYFDYESTLICGLTIVLGMTIYSASKSNNQEVVWPFYMLLIIFNTYFCTKLGYYIFYAQVEIHQDKLDKIRNRINEKYPNLKSKSFFLKRLLTNRAEERQRMKVHFKKIKEYLFQFSKEVCKIKQEHQMANSLESEENKELKLNARVYPLKLDSEVENISLNKGQQMRLKVVPDNHFLSERYDNDFDNQLEQQQQQELSKRQEHNQLEKQKQKQEQQQQQQQQYQSLKVKELNYIHISSREEQIDQVNYYDQAQIDK